MNIPASTDDMSDEEPGVVEHPTTTSNQEPTLPPGPFSFGEWLRVRFLGHDAAGEREIRLRNLNHAIRRNPASPANYVIRGELYLTVGYEALARVDFEQALKLAATEYAEDAWGLLSQSLRDRAQEGLRQLDA